MRRIHLVPVVFMMLSVFTFTSCEVEPIDPAVLTEIPQNPTNPTDPTDPGDGSTSSGDYWPAALNNTWTFDNGAGEYDMKMISINSIDGFTYYTFNPQAGTSGSGIEGSSTMRMRKAGGNYYLKYDDIVVAPQNGMPGSTTTGSEVILLKDNVPVGTTWTKEYTQTTSFTDPIFPTIAMSVSMTGSIEEKDISLTVDGETYNDVIKAKLVNVSTMQGLPPSTATSYYYFSKDVGPVKIENVGQTSNLVEYILN